VSLLDATALTTTAALVDELGLTGEQSTTRLERVVMVASARVAAYLGRPVHYGAAVVETLPATGGDVLFLSRAPVVSVTSVTLSTDGGATSETIDASDYTLELGADANDVLGVLRHLGGGWGFSGSRFGAAGDPLPGTERQVYTVTYAGGWVTPGQATAELPRTLPYDVEGAVLDLAVDAWRDRGRDKSIVKRTLLSGSVTYATDQAGALPESVRHVLDRYKRRAI
jgi:hypothetical protein